jgi:hypothetical protein
VALPSQFGQWLSRRRPSRGHFRAHRCRRAVMGLLLKIALWLSRCRLPKVVFIAIAAAAAHFP